MHAFIIVIALLSVAFAATSEEPSNRVEGFVTSGPLGPVHAMEGEKVSPTQVTPAQSESVKPIVQACTCYGCTNTYSIPALSTYNLHLATPCTGGAKATVSGINIERTDSSSSFDLCTRDTSSSTTCYTAAYGTSLTCFQMASTVYIKGSNSDIYVSIQCDSYSSCPIRYTLSMGCEAATTYAWVTGSWGTCSVTCGGGTQTRSVTCKDNSGTTVSDSYCTATKPSTSQACNTQQCQSSDYQVTGRLWVNTPSCSSGTSACKCSCCIGNGCTMSLAGGFSVSSCDACSSTSCASNYPTKCPGTGVSGSSSAFCASSYGLTPGATPGSCYADSDSSYDVTCSSTGYTFHAYTGTTCASASLFKTVNGENGMCYEVDALNSVALTCKLNAAPGLHVAWISLLAIMLFGALLAVF